MKLSPVKPVEGKRIEQHASARRRILFSGLALKRRERASAEPERGSVSVSGNGLFHELHQFVYRPPGVQNKLREPI